MREPLLQNYEGWRILDNPKMTLSEAYFWDLGGYVRHLDPIIDDPRLTHRQRVTRLYRWSLKELQMALTRNNGNKFNIAYKVVRGRFEKYRYVTDPAMCDMMVRETQRYLREMANVHYMRKDPRSQNSHCYMINPMFHPDNSYCYDHWTQSEVHWYDYAKMHRFRAHHPMLGEQEFSNRFGDGYEASPFYRYFSYAITFAMYFYAWIWQTTFLCRWHDRDDEEFLYFNSQFTQSMRMVSEYHERMSRSHSGDSWQGWNWDHVLGVGVYPKVGYLARAGQYYEKPEWVKQMLEDATAHVK